MQPLLAKIAELGLNEDDPKSLEALWPHLSEVIRAACTLEAPRKNITPQALGGLAVRDLIRHHRAKNAR